MICPLCSSRKARRACPALDRQICAVCCGTKRLTEIRCPASCGYLASSREHPPAVAVRQQQRDVGILVQAMRDFSRRQSRLFLGVSTLIARHQPDELRPLRDDDVAEAAASLAATFETAARGVIYEHQPTSLPAARLAAALKSALVEAGRGEGSPFERDGAIVLRRVAEAVRDARAVEPDHPRAFLELLVRMARTADGESPPDAKPDEPRLIVP